MKCGVTPEEILELKENEVFVFGSNLAGVHGAGAAHTAMKWGAIMGFGEGLYGQTYALPTKDHNIRTRDIRNIYSSVVTLFLNVQHNPDKHYLITKVGCGLAGLDVKQVAPLFKGFQKLENCSLPQEFIKILEKE